MNSFFIKSIFNFLRSFCPAIWGFLFLFDTFHHRTFSYTNGVGMSLCLFSFMLARSQISAVFFCLSNIRCFYYILCAWRCAHTNKIIHIIDVRRAKQYSNNRDKIKNPQHGPIVKWRQHTRIRLHLLNCQAKRQRTKRTHMNFIYIDTHIHTHSQTETRTTWQVQSTTFDAS